MEDQSTRSKIETLSYTVDRVNKEIAELIQTDEYTGYDQSSKSKGESIGKADVVSNIL